MDLAINNALVADYENLTFRQASVGIQNGKIKTVSQTPIDADVVIDADGNYLSVGLIDCHCHIESSYMLPEEFGRTIATFGTLFAVADCHEIANVKGIKGVEFFIENAKRSPALIKFSIPSCVPATEFGTSGGSITPEDVSVLINNDRVVGLGELMNVPGVVGGDPKFKEMIKIAKQAGKRVDGHAPMLDLETLKKYKAAGVDNDHESYSYDELKQKIELGFFVFLREGSAEHLEDKAYSILEEYPDNAAFCSDDKTVEDIFRFGHMNYNLKRAISLGVKPIIALKAASYNGLKHYGFNEFLKIEKGYRANLVLFDKNFDVVNVIVNGKLLKEDSTKPVVDEQFYHTINIKTPIETPEIAIENLSIGIKNGSLITDKIETDDEIYDLETDTLKLAVFERYGHNNKAACKIRGFGLKKGALASSVAHDCHNIVAVGTSDEAIKVAVETVVKAGGGQAVYDGKKTYILKLPVGGIVSDKKADEILKEEKIIKEKAQELGCNLSSPFGMLSFMALEVIPHLKLTDKGLFDVDRFEFVK
ncbi:adenine deaminase [Hippea jasoniae]|uniref:adenine deaminase n=1 Tax=Hippea jasoniae TaxID=944479 RepID=UPI00054E29CA|nr:adenine deaminase C-terminal domain-containing protein [Hippea jasoniae]